MDNDYQEWGVAGLLNGGAMTESNALVFTEQNYPEKVIARITEELAPVTTAIAEFTAKSENMEIFDDAGAVEGVAVMGKIKSIQNDMESRRKETSGKLDALAKSINACFRTPSVALERIKNDIGKKVIDFREKEKAAHDIEAKRLQRLIDAENARIEKEQSTLAAQYLAEKKESMINGTPAPAMPEALIHPPINTIAPPPIEKTIKSGSGSATAREVSKFEVINPMLVPDEYWVIDESRVRARINSGVTEILGVRIWKETALTIRGGR